ncbi:MAG: hypothetical protein LC650_01920 [Actinobacteria bacterium]|nr:hypothetical protein [Actinomycetota bacterium]
MSSSEEQQAIRLARDADTLGARGLEVNDTLELVYRFIFDPRSDYREITKLWSITDLTEAEVERIVQLAKNVRILDNSKFYRKRTRRVPTDKMQEYADPNTSQVVYKLVYREEEVLESRFEDRLIQRYIGEIQAVCAAAGGRHASVIRAFRTATQQQHQSVEDRTDRAAGWLPGGRRQ